jgi:hypothetical protein
VPKRIAALQSRFVSKVLILIVLTPAHGRWWVGCVCVCVCGRGALACGGGWTCVCLVHADVRAHMLPCSCGALCGRSRVARCTRSGSPMERSTAGDRTSASRVHPSTRVPHEHEYA